MPMLAFLPWTTATESLFFGRFRAAPVAAALGSGDVPEEHADAIRTILASYEKKRRVDQDSVTLIRREDRSFTDNLSDEEVTEYFGFRTRLAFAVLAARRFFAHRYANSDNVTLVIQGFTPERAGGATLQHRRRDGSLNIIVPPGNLNILRPHHLGACAVPEDLDVGVLASLEAAVAAGGPHWPPLAEALRLFVGANTDGPAIGMHAELIDVVSAFSRMAGSWKQNDTVAAFSRALPSPFIGSVPTSGAKLAKRALQEKLKKGRNLREIWLDDAYVLRSTVAHGNVETPTYDSIWTEREHLLLSAVVFPLYVKASLNGRGLYEWTEDDEMMRTAFDDLALLEPFALADDETAPWHRAIGRAQSRRLETWIEREWANQTATDAEEPQSAESAGG